MGDANYGGMGKFMLEYGLLVGLSYIIFALYYCINKKYLIPTLGLLIICVILNGLNSQIALLCISLLFISKYFKISHHNTCDLRISYKMLI